MTLLLFSSLSLYLPVFGLFQCLQPPYFITGQTFLSLYVNEQITTGANKRSDFQQHLFVVVSVTIQLPDHVRQNYNPHWTSVIKNTLHLQQVWKRDIRERGVFCVVAVCFPPILPPSSIHVHTRSQPSLHRPALVSLTGERLQGCQSALFQQMKWGKGSFCPLRSLTPNRLP